MLTVERIACPQALAEIEHEWTALVDRVPDATPFYRPEWLLPWWRQFGSGHMHVLAFRSHERLTGLIGLFIHEWGGCRRVTLIGNGITDYLGLIAEPESAIECARLTFEYLTANRGLWDMCDWQDLRSDSPVIREAPWDLDREIVDYLPCTRAELPSHEDAFEASLPHGLRRTIRIAARRLERDGELRFETVRENADASVLRDLFRLHESRWAMKGGPESMMDCPGTQQFLLEATQQFSRLDRLRLYTMRYRGELAAVIYCIFDCGRLWGYITGMDPELSRFSPGTLVLNYAIGEAIREGASAWEFLRGKEDYKFLWGAQTVPKSRLMVWANGRT